jgi:hypothetical protein
MTFVPGMEAEYPIVQISFLEEYGHIFQIIPERYWRITLSFAMNHDPA